MCAVCKSEIETTSQSRRLEVSDCEQYGMNEADHRPDMRVCSNCRCKSVRRRVSQ